MSRLLLIITALFLVSCADSVNKNFKDSDDKKIESMITRGVTTKQDLQETFGKPTSIDFDKSGQETWSYAYSEASGNPLNYFPVSSMLKGQTGTTREMLIIFNGDIVQNYVITSKEEKIKKGALDD
ncbi:MAG: hypothetical protein N4A31_05610 [Rickettsiales bacterium]|jgi:outer membrane protein assembly factor BamE (lipoprotein component of BamABCDE complex)|nr:hypothetical protein [Rickettsiales bacterium]